MNKEKKICPFQYIAYNIGYTFCQEEKCMAWGAVDISLPPTTDYDEMVYGCKLIEKP